MKELANTPVDLKNTQKCSIDTLFEKDDQSLLFSENKAGETVTTDSLIKKGIIHFYFCLEGKATFSFGPNYVREIVKGKNYFFYNPDKDLAFNLGLVPDSKMVFMTISLESLHKLFVHDALPLLNPENSNRKFYDERDIPSSLLLVLTQLLTTQLSVSAQKLFYQGKFYELLSLYFSNRLPNTENCPFLNDEATVRKIKNAKEYLLKNIDSPPSLKDLAKITGLNDYQLKVGFKEIYGNTVYGFLLEHKLDNARMLLDSAKHQVNEVAYQIGYTNPSHFIAAFKKKFGITPKKYLMRAQQK